MFCGPLLFNQRISRIYWNGPRWLKTPSISISEILGNYTEILYLWWFSLVSSRLPDLDWAIFTPDKQRHNKILPLTLRGDFTSCHVQWLITNERIKLLKEYLYCLHSGGPVLVWRDRDMQQVGGIWGLCLCCEDHGAHKDLWQHGAYWNILSFLCNR